MDETSPINHCRRSLFIASDVRVPLCSSTYTNNVPFTTLCLALLWCRRRERIINPRTRRYKCVFFLTRSFSLFSLLCTHTASRQASTGILPFPHDYPATFPCLAPDDGHSMRYVRCCLCRTLSLIRSRNDHEPMDGHSWHSMLR